MLREIEQERTVTQLADFCPMVGALCPLTGLRGSICKLSDSSKGTRDGAMQRVLIAEVRQPVDRDPGEIVRLVAHDQRRRRIGVEGVADVEVVVLEWYFIDQ